MGGRKVLSSLLACPNFSSFQLFAPESRQPTLLPTCLMPQTWTSFPQNNPLHYLYYKMDQFSLYYWKPCRVLISKQISYGIQTGFVGTRCFQDVLGVVKCARVQGIYISTRASLLHKHSLSTYRVPDRMFAAGHTIINQEVFMFPWEKQICTYLKKRGILSESVT